VARRQFKASVVSSNRERWNEVLINPSRFFHRELRQSIDAIHNVLVEK